MTRTGSILPADLQDQLIELYWKAVESIADETGIDADAIDFSPYELALALEESRKDLEVMITRRYGAKGEDFDGLSVGKLAGILVFRLSRCRIVHVDAASIAGSSERVKRIASKLQEIAALRFACEAVLKVHPRNWHPELLYVLSRRHTNQEMLGVTFDVIAANCARLRTRTPLDQPPYDKFFKRAS